MMKNLLGVALTLVLLGSGVYGGWRMMAYFHPRAPLFPEASESVKKADSNAASVRKSEKLAAMAASSGKTVSRNSVTLPCKKNSALSAELAEALSARRESATREVAATAAESVLPPLPAQPVQQKREKKAAPAPADLAGVYQKADSLAREKQFAAAGELLRKNILPGNNPANAVTLYRLGLIGRYAGTEDAAQAAWSRAHGEYPLTPAGRMSAIALADTWYAWYAGNNPRYDEWEKIRDMYSDALGMDGARFLDAANEARIARRLHGLNERLVFSPDMKVRGAQFHTVRSGENLTTIARQYNLDTWRSIVAVNHINPSALRVGNRLKIMTGRVFVLVSKRNFTLSWYLDGVFLRRYRCATGAVGSETPPGRYKIVRMDVNPDWRDPKTGRTYKYGEPGHAIGSRWMALEGEGTSGLGIHGTIEPESMGKKASNGCIRLLKNDVEELYGFVSIQRGNETEVLIME